MYPETPRPSPATEVSNMRSCLASIAHHRPPLSEGDRAWLGLLGYVVAYDMWALRTGRETLSASYYNALTSSMRRYPTVVVWVYLTAHLFRLLPQRWDILR